MAPPQACAIAVASAKGGSSKTSLTCNLAVRAADDGQVSLMDVDPQPSLTIWYDHRRRGVGGTNPGLLRREQGSLIERVDLLKNAGADWIFMDLPPGDFDLIEPGIIAADFVIVPVRPSPIDFEAFDPVVELCDTHDKPFCFVLTQFDKSWKLSQSAKPFLEKKRADHVLDETFSYRQAYVGAMISGRTGPEFQGDAVQAKNARDEIDRLWKAVKARATEAMKAMAR